MIAPRSDDASVHDHERLIDRDDPNGRKTDAEDRHRARGLDDAGQQRGNQKGEHERSPRVFEHLPEPGLLGERCGGILEQFETEDDHRATEARQRHRLVSSQPLAAHGHRAEPEYVERNHLDVERDDEEENRHADPPAEKQGKCPLGGDQSGAKDADDDEGQRGHALGNPPREASPEQCRESVRGPATRRPAKPAARQRPQILGEQPHAQDEQAEAADDPGDIVCEDSIGAKEPRRARIAAPKPVVGSRSPGSGSNPEVVRGLSSRHARRSNSDCCRSSDCHGCGRHRPRFGPPMAR